MSNKFVVALVPNNPKKNETRIAFRNRNEREAFLSLLNKAYSVEASIKLQSSKENKEEK